MTKQYDSKNKLCFLAIVCTLLWGSAIPMIKLGYKYFNIMPDFAADKLFFAGVRFLFAGVVILVPLFVSNKKIVIVKETIFDSLIIGLVQTAGQYFFMYMGIAYTNCVNASIFNSLGTLFYIVFAWLIFTDEKVTIYKIIGCIVSFSGVLLNSISTQKIGILSFKGDGFIILANICVAIGFLYSKHSVKRTNAFLLTGIQMFVGGSVLLVLGSLLGGRLPQITFQGCVILLYLVIVSAVAFSLWTLLLLEYPPALVGMFNFLTPIFGFIFSYILNVFEILKENSRFTACTILAIVLSAGGIFLSSVNNISEEQRCEKRYKNTSKKERKVCYENKKSSINTVSDGHAIGLDSI